MKTSLIVLALLGIGQSHRLSKRIHNHNLVQFIDYDDDYDVDAD
jgi:hypothetical protein